MRTCGDSEEILGDHKNAICLWVHEPSIKTVKRKTQDTHQALERATIPGIIEEEGMRLQGSDAEEPTMVNIGMR